jgi:hypothetical protein
MNKKTKIILGIIVLYKNFITVFLDYFHIIPANKIIYRLRNGIKYICRTKTDDFSIINELYIFNAYLNYKDVPSKKEKVILDLGTHIGIFSIQAAKQFHLQQFSLLSRW